MQVNEDLGIENSYNLIRKVLRLITGSNTFADEDTLLSPLLTAYI
jgi:hypothetical protein